VKRAVYQAGHIWGQFLIGETQILWSRLRGNAQNLKEQSLFCDFQKKFQREKSFLALFT